MKLGAHLVAWTAGALLAAAWWALHCSVGRIVRGLLVEP